MKYRVTAAGVSTIVSGGLQLEDFINHLLSLGYIKMNIQIEVI